MAEGTLLLANKVHTQMNLSGSSSQLDTLTMFHCCRHSLGDKYDKLNHPTKGDTCELLANVQKGYYQVAILAFVTENWRLGTISAAETSRTVQTLIRNGTVITSMLSLYRY